MMFCYSITKRSYLSDINPHILFFDNNNNDDDRNTQTTMLERGDLCVAYETYKVTKIHKKKGARSLLSSILHGLLTKLG